MKMREGSEFYEKRNWIYCIVAGSQGGRGRGGDV